MILKNQVEWALHCASILARLPEGVRLSTKALADFHGVPKEYLSKALQALSTAGLVEGTLGPKGGYRLAKAAGEISFLDIVEAVEGAKRTFNCSEIRQNNPCLEAKTEFPKPCAIARVMWDADEAWRAVLAQKTLADVMTALESDVAAEDLQKAEDWLMSYS